MSAGTQMGMRRLGDYVWGRRPGGWRMIQAMAEYRGQVKWFNNLKGYGFLGRPDGPDVFCHYSSIEGDGYKTLREGDEVEFNVIVGRQGPQAEKVKRASPGRS
jgi:CspA family cold shock protein